MDKLFAVLAVFIIRSNFIRLSLLEVHDFPGRNHGLLFYLADVQHLAPILGPLGFLGVHHSFTQQMLVRRARHGVGC
jgi:hypothetical protein